jgi:hypothetical protein
VSLDALSDTRPPESAEWLPAGFREPPTRWLRGRLDEVIASLPEFERGPFAMAPENEGPWHPNELLDLISTRETNAGDWQRRPVAVVSKSYRLIPHREVAVEVAQALSDSGIEADGLDTHASLDRYGGRMALEINMPAHWLVNPGDGHPLVLQLRCLNSVDATATLRMRFIWYRLVCTNGLAVGFCEDERRLRHRGGARPHDLRGELEDGLAAARADRLAMARWLERPVDAAILAGFADGPLKSGWGARDAARFLHIVRTGFDAEFADRFQPGSPSEKSMIATVRVPGSPTVARTEWDVAQALSWVARDRRDPAEHLDRLLDIPPLLSRLHDFAGRARWRME